jgi:PAS domain S-box-containing protein
VESEAGRIVDCNEQLAGMLGYSVAELRGTELASLVAPEDRDQVMSIIGQGQEARIEYGMLLKDGKRIVVEAHSRPVFTGSPRCHAAVRDITERKRAEEALTLTLESIADGFFAVDSEWRFVYVNAVAERVLGIRRAEVVGRSHWEVFPLTLGTNLEVEYRRAAAGEVRDFENFYEPWTRWFHNTCYPRPGGGMSVYFRDITERKHAEKAVQEANARLRDEDRRKNEFLAVLSHELRNPLAPIRNSTYILEHSAPGGEQAKRAVAVIDRQAGQLAHLVDDLLDVTRITQNKIQLQRQTLDLNEIVRHAMEDQRSLFDKSEVHLKFDPAPRQVLVNADRNRLAQVIGNLLQNAAKFTGRGGETRITVSVDATEQRAVVQVADTGVGMTPEMVSRLFQPFSQADSTLDRSKGGLGLGLALAKGLVELHGGDVAARSAGVGQGAEFVVRLPMAMETAATAEPCENAARSCQRVLVIEDNVDAADSLRDVLAFGEHQVEVAYNGREGIAKAREFRPDVVLCDIGLPGMDGYGVARAFRADDTLKGTFLVALSGYALPEDLQRATEAGFDRHLAKPPSMEKLTEILESRAGRS